MTATSLSLLEVGELSALKSPALVPWSVRQPWLVLADQHNQSQGAELCEAVLLQQLAHYTAKTSRLFLFESSPTSSFAHLKRLLALAEVDWGEQLFTAKAVLAEISALEELVHRRFSLLAQAGLSDIHAYNQQAASKEPMIFLLINGLNKAITDVAVLHQLETLCDQGGAVGIVPVFLLPLESSVTASLSSQASEAVSAFYHKVRSTSSGIDLRGDSPVGLSIPISAWKLLERFGLQLDVTRKNAQWCDELVSVKQEEDERGERDFISIPIGVSGAVDIRFNMGEKSDVYHALIGGATRTGKTTLLNNLILSACEMYSPDVLQLYLMDFKDGVSFWEYEGLAHIANLYAPPDDDFDAALECLNHFKQQISVRNTLFRKHRVARLSDYNNLAESPLPRLLLVIDEAQSLFEGRDYQQKGQVKQLISAIAKKGASAGLHMILSTQSFQNVELEGDVRDQIHLRIGLRHASSMGCRALMGRDNDAMLELPRFTAIYNAHQGEAKHNRQVALSDVGEFLQRLERLKESYPLDKHDMPVTAEPTAVSGKDKLYTTEPATTTSRFADGRVDEPW